MIEESCVAADKMTAGETQKRVLKIFRAWKSKLHDLETEVEAWTKLRAWQYLAVLVAHVM